MSLRPLFCVMLVVCLDLCPFPAWAGRLGEVRFHGERVVLSDVEEALWEAVRLGRPYSAEGRTVDSRFFYWLCNDPEARKRITGSGIRLARAKIGVVDVQHADIPFPIMFSGCEVEVANLQYATLRHLTMFNTRVKLLNAVGATFETSLNLQALQPVTLALDEARVLGDVVMTNLGDDGLNEIVSMNGAQVQGKVDLSGAAIGRRFEFASAYVRDSLRMESARVGFKQSGDDRFAVNGDFCRIGESLYMLNEFQSHGPVSLVGAEIGGLVNFAGAEIEGRDGRGLNLEGARLGGSAFFRRWRSADTVRPFRLTGELDINSAVVAGTLDCEGAVISNPGRTTVDCNFTKVGGSVFLRRGFRSEGTVNLQVAEIAGDLECAEATFEGGGIVLQGSGLRVAGDLYGNKSLFRGQISLIAARVGRTLNMSGARLLNPNGMALEANGIRVGQYALFRDGFYAEGMVDLAASVIDRHLAICDSPLPDNCVLQLSSAVAGEFRDDPQSWPAPGNLLLTGFSYGQFDPRALIDAKTRIDWLERMDGYYPQPYEQVARMLAEAGRPDDARAVLIRKSEREEAHMRDIPSRVWSVVKGVTLGYGYESWRAGVWLAALWGVGTFLFAVGYARRLLVPEDGAARQEEGRGGDEREFNPLVYSLDLCVPLINLRQADGWSPRSAPMGPPADKGLWARLVRFPLQGWMLRLYYWVHIILGWVLITLFVMGMAGLVQR